MSSFQYTTPSGKSWWLTAQSPSSSPLATPLHNVTTTTREGNPFPIDPDAGTSSSSPAIVVDNTSPSLLTPAAARRRARRARRRPSSHNQGGEMDGENIPPPTATRPTRPARERRTTTRAHQRTHDSGATCSGEPRYRRVMADLPHTDVAPRQRARTLREIDNEASSSSQ